MAAGYLLDTNVISETRRKAADAGVMAFLMGADGAALFLSVLCLGELRKGALARRLRDPATAAPLVAWVDEVERDFSGRILPVDLLVASRWGELSAARSGPVIDTLIAATALVHGLTLVTRNVKDFQSSGVNVLNPWGA